MNPVKIVTTIIIIAWSVPSIGQVFSRGISAKGKDLKYLGAPTIKTKEFTLSADKIAPFDQPFLLSFKTPTFNQAYPKGSKKHTLKKVEIYQVGKNANRKIVYSSNPRVGKVFTDSKNHLLQINPIRPNQAYVLELTWDQGKSQEYTFTTVSSKLKERVKQRIVAQLGVAFSYFESNKEIITEPSAIYAIHYYPRPVNPELPIGNYHAFAPQRFSVMLGLTLTSLAEENLREDLIGKNNLLFGLSYQPVDAIRISVGKLFFNELDPNEFSTNKEIASTLYTSLSIDLQLKDLFGGLITTLGF